MNVQELIDKLETIKDKERMVYIEIREPYDIDAEILQEYVTSVSINDSLGIVLS